MTNRSGAVLLLVLAGLGAVAAWTDEVGDDKRSIWGEINHRHELKKLRKLLEHEEYKDYREALDGHGPMQGTNFTFFAPDNHAFKYLKHKMKIDKRYTKLLRVLLKYHAVEGAVRTSDLSAKQFLESYANDEHFVKLPNQRGQVIQLVKEGEHQYITYGLSKHTYRIKVVTKDVECTNGILNVVDRVLLLPRRTTTMAGFQYLYGFVEGLIKFDLASKVNDETGMTVIAPTEVAWLKFFMDYGKVLKEEDLESIFKFLIVNEDDAYYTDQLRDPAGKKVLETLFTEDKLHVRVDEAGRLFINEKAVVAEDILTTNGVIHVVEEVLVPPSLLPKLNKARNQVE